MDWDGAGRIGVLGMSNILFKENQSLRSQGILLVVWMVASVVVIHQGYSFYMRIIKGVPWGGQSQVSDGWFIGLTIIYLALAGVLIWIGYRLELRVKVDLDCLYISYFPFVKRIIPLSRIVNWEARQYNPLKEYGGRGIKWGGRDRGWSYTVSGNWGLALELEDGKKLLVGTQKPEEFA